MVFQLSSRIVGGVLEEAAVSPFIGALGKSWFLSWWTFPVADPVVGGVRGPVRVYATVNVSVQIHE